MITDAEAAGFCAGAYAITPPGVVVDFQDCRAVLTTLADGSVVVAFRGTEENDLANWWRDFDAVPERSAQYAALGWCHAGFFDGGIGLLAPLYPMLKGRRVILTGHSLGGALAIVVAGLLTALFTPPELVVTFEAPKAGGHRLRDLMSLVPVRQYRFGNDPVTLFPDFPLLFCHVREPLIAIGRDALNAIECHFMAGIVAWFAALPVVGTAAA